VCLANYGASEAFYPCIVVEKIHEYFRSKNAPISLDNKSVVCLANYGASEAFYPCIVVEKIHEYFRSKNAPISLENKSVVV